MSSTTPIYVAVVDDDESLCRSLGRLLRAAKIQAVTYSSAEAFLASSLVVSLAPNEHDDFYARLAAEKFAPLTCPGAEV